MSDEPDIEALSTAGKAPSPTARIDAVNKTLGAMYVHKPLPTTYKDITEAAGYHPTTVSLALNTARDIGLTQSAGRKGLYNFTDAGIDYCRNLQAKRLPEAKTILRNLLLTNPLWNDVVGFLKANQNESRDPLDLTMKIEKRLGKTWSGSMQKTVVDSLVSVLEFAELVRVEAGKIVSLIGADESPEPINFDLNPKGTYTNERHPPGTIVAPIIGRSSMPPGSDYFEYRDEGVYIKIRKDERSVSLAKDLVELFAKRHQSGLQTTKVEETPGKN
jgi:hypothetical protein